VSAVEALPPENGARDVAASKLGDSSNAYARFVAAESVVLANNRFSSNKATRYLVAAENCIVSHG